YPVPAFLSTAGYWCYIDAAQPVCLDFRRAYTLLESTTIPREVVLGFDDDPTTLLCDLSTALGRQAPPPSWAFDGAILGIGGGLAELRKKLDVAIESGAPVSAIWVRDWCGRRDPSAKGARAWAWDRGLYPDLPAEIAALRSQGIRFMGYVSDLLATDGPAYGEASERGLCVRSPGGADLVLGPQEHACAMLDLSSPEARAWIEETITREMVGIGMSGWVADTGERISADAVLASGADPAAARLAWPALWARSSRAAIGSSARPEEMLIFLRSGWLGSGRGRGAAWAGDRASDFSADGLGGIVPAALSLGFSGIGFWHSEIGGSRSPGRKGRSADCLGRWEEAAAFSPFFRSSEGGAPGADAQPWSSAASLARFARMAGVFAALKPYHSAAAEDYASGGLPPIRHPWVHYPKDACAPDLERQYLYGADLMVAPALAPEAELTSLYLPEDEWVHLWSSRRFAGGGVTVDSPPGCPAVFYRASSPFASLFDAVRRTARRLM
ncbi:MAG: glycoside hydrolase family 31 protein, partial [Spirochaetaceae bacterium]|nr:glycoside hydrolase family 31 protein [Spirochaetaceae bacterium]